MWMEMSGRGPGRGVTKEAGVEQAVPPLGLRGQTPLS